MKILVLLKGLRLVRFLQFLRIWKFLRLVRFFVFFLRFFEVVEYSESIEVNDFFYLRVFGRCIRICNVRKNSVGNRFKLVGAFLICSRVLRLGKLVGSMKITKLVRLASFLR